MIDLRNGTLDRAPKKLLSSRSPIVVEGAEPCRPPIHKTLVFGTGRRITESLTSNP